MHVFQIGSPIKVSISTPANGTVDQTHAITIELRDQFDNAAFYQDIVNITLIAGGSVDQRFNLVLINGSVSVSLKRTTPQSIPLVLQDNFNSPFSVNSSDFLHIFPGTLYVSITRITCD